ncbi:MAG: hypothetical protein GKR88_05815 [Flavobacteriaceae bacterium]|nr:MAG: hypothetical protein GKR88_05815 [Flavobacteriaceae bacterium]
MKAWLYNSNLDLHPGSGDVIAYAQGLVSTKITNTHGFVYTFSDFSLNVNSNQVTSWDESNFSPLQPLRVNRFIDTQKLTTLFDPITNSSVHFDYHLPYQQNEFWKTKGIFRPDQTLGSKNVQTNFHKKRTLKKIRFDQGEIVFFYEFTRLDLPDYSGNIALDNKALSKIIVKDVHGTVIKDIRFVYSHIRSVENCSQPECYRLVLDEVYFAQPGGTNSIPGYTLEYNTTKLPKRNSWVSDFLGYHNGEVASPAPTTSGHYIPKTYHYPNSGKYSFLPFDIGNSNYTQLPGNFSLASNEAYVRAALLEKITYPTGGYTLLESESNNFILLGKPYREAGLE